MHPCVLLFLMLCFLTQTKTHAGASSVSLDGDDREKLVVMGEVDAICLAKILRKKFKCVTLVSVEDVKKPKEEKKKECKNICYPPPCPLPPCPPCLQPCHGCSNEQYGSNCFIL